MVHEHDGTSVGKRTQQVEERLQFIALGRFDRNSLEAATLSRWSEVNSFGPLHREKIGELGKPGG